MLANLFWLYKYFLKKLFLEAQQNLGLKSLSGITFSLKQHPPHSLEATENIY